MNEVKAVTVCATTTPDRFTVTLPLPYPQEVLSGWLVEWYWCSGLKCGKIRVQTNRLEWLEVWFYEEEVRW